MFGLRKIKAVYLDIRLVTMFRKKQESDAKIKELRDSLGPLSGKNLTFCTDACLKRYLVARSWNVKKANKMLEDTLQWRASYKPEEIAMPEVPFESETAKVSIANFRDRLGRSVLITKPGYQSNPRHFFYNIEKALLNLPEGQEQIVLLSDLTGLSYEHFLLFKDATEVALVLENHYPETVGLVIIYNPSRVVHAILKTTKFFLDSISLQKIKIVLPKNKRSVELMSSFFDTDILPMMSSGEISGNCFGPRQPLLPPSSPTTTLGFNLSTFTIAELAAATGRFAQSNRLGQGGFGYVHKGVLPNGKEVAIKSLKLGSGQGELEFQAEVEIISRLHHRHLVSLVGYCIDGDQRMLVYEFVPNKTLEYHLHGSGRPVMDWPSRLRIALGSAKGLAYLHEDCHSRIIHRDIKAANILIDNNFEALVADFGLAKLTPDNDTHVSTRVMGTFGYLAPEYAASGQLTERSDVFSFGVMLLELITGKRPVNSIRDEDSLVDWARPLLALALEDGNYDELVDPRLGNNYNRQEMKRLIACASASISHSSRKRPRMSKTCVFPISFLQ